MRGRSWLVVLVAVVVPTPAHAATGQVIGARSAAAEVAVDDRGRAFVVSPAHRPDRGTLPVVRRRAAAPGAMFGRPRTLLRSGAGKRAVGAGVAADGSGVIVVASRRGPYRRVRAVTFGPAGRVGRPVTLSAGRGDADFAASAVARSGAAVVVWFRHRAGGRWRLEAATRAPGRVRFGPPQRLSAWVRLPCCTDVAVAIGERGDAAAAWRSTARLGIWAALRSAGRRFARPRRVAEGPSDVPHVVVGAGGTAALLYVVEHLPRRAGDGLRLHRAVPGGAFGAAEHVGPGCAPSTAQAAVTPAGRILAACAEPGDGHAGARVHVVEAEPGKSPVATGPLGTHVPPTRLAVAADERGRAVVAWPQRLSAGPPYREQAVAAIRPATGAPFGTPVALGGAWSAAEPGTARLVPGAGALVTWRAGRFGRRVGRPEALVATRLP